MKRRDRHAEPHLRCLTRGDVTFCALDKVGNTYVVSEEGQAQLKFAEKDKAEADAAYDKAFARQVETVQAQREAAMRFELRG